MEYLDKFLDKLTESRVIVSSLGCGYCVFMGVYFTLSGTAPVLAALHLGVAAYIHTMIVAIIASK